MTRYCSLTQPSVRRRHSHATLTGTLKRAYGGCPRPTPPDTLEAIRHLARVVDDEYIAQALSRAGLRTAQGHNWTRERVASLRHTHGIERFSVERKETEGWMTLSGAARQLDVADVTLKRAVARGALKAVQPLPNGPWIVNRKDFEGFARRVRLRTARTSEEGDAVHSPQQLTLEILNR